MRHALALRGGLAAAGLAALTATACAPPATPRSDVTPTASRPTGPATLPAPTGTRPVGTTSLYLKDTSRPDPWVPEVKARELKVTLWYPAREREGTRAAYMTPKESELILKGKRVTSAPYDILSRTRTNAFTGAKPSGAEGGLPLVVLSPGFTMPPTTLTALAEDLAAGGYVVAAVHHTYENYATTFPGGRIAECVACDSDTDFGFGTRVVGIRAADVSFVLDRLTGSDAKWEGSSLIDPAKIAMVGQSLGGAAAVATMLEDPRVRAGVNMDGTTYARIPKSGLSRPFLFLGSSGHPPGGRDNSWDRDWKLLTGWKRWLLLPKGDHQAFTDVPLLADVLGIKNPSDLSASRSTELTRTYVRAFLDLHLRRTPQPLLDGPSPRYPEVEFCTPGRKACG
ncbi:alpha/beta hydrolase [Sphaerisporangium sp. B11E5]|uniref:alpha/beta hydrolase family protein n=1 Tax=Sphaerisporangium sp. B11E5 TaxID=3153563 RepID=UPI00325F1A7D